MRVYDDFCDSGYDVCGGGESDAIGGGGDDSNDGDKGRYGILIVMVINDHSVIVVLKCGR